MRPRALLALAAALLTVSTAALAAVPGMTDIEAVVAKSEITELMYRYALAHNSFDADGYVALFTDDAQFGTGPYAFKGKEGIRKLAEGTNRVLTYPSGKNDVEGDRHYGTIRTIIQNPVVDIIDKTHAKGVFYVQIITENPDVPVVMLQGSYQCEFRKVHGKWLISKMEVFSSMYNKEAGDRKGLQGGRPKAN
jgi:hypothetical protein